MKVNSLDLPTYMYLYPLTGAEMTRYIRPEARNLDQPIIWITQTVATVLSSAKITTTEIMRACMKFQIIQFLL